jgi:polysaccharide chain length determinant protein (PEP-CTERM system associated)
MKREDTVSGFALAGLEYYSTRDYLNVVKSRKWLLLSVTLFLALATAIVAKLLPNHYNATTVILVDPRKVPDNMVMSTVTSGVSDRLVTIREQILSATRLAQVIDEMQLYSDMKGKYAQEEIVNAMRKAITIDVVAISNADRGLGAFRVTYDNTDPAKAARVTNRLASLFIEQNIKDREQQVLGTADFLGKEVQEAKQDLDKKEEEIRKLKVSHMADMPESQTVHVQALSSLQLDLRAEIEAAARSQQQIAYLQTMMQQSRPVVNLDTSNPSAAAEIDLQQQLAAVQGEISELRVRYGPQHPDVLSKQADAKKIQDKIAALKNSPEAKRSAPAPPKSINPVVEAQITAAQQEQQQHLQRQSEIKSQMTYHQDKLARIPVVEQQIASVMRDYQSAQDQYKRLLDRKFSADMSSDLESRQKGERFVVLDPAQVPVKPVSPNRSLIDAMGVLLGTLLALGLAFVLEVIDDSVKVEGELKENMQMQILGEVPWLTTPQQKRAARVRTLLAAGANSVLLLIYVAFVSLTV